MRVAIVNDLAIAREILVRLIHSAPGHSVAWTAGDGAEAVRKAGADRPDVILMDLIMPVMDGVEATRRIMADSPCPILLVTASVASNFDRVFEAMGCGGIDAVNTPRLGRGGAIEEGEAILSRLTKLERMRGAGSGVLPALSIAPRSPDHGRAGKLVPGHPLIAIGASTGGPEALARILSGLPRNLSAAVVIVQHIAADYASNLTNWLQRHSALPVRVVTEGSRPSVGEVLLAASNDHLVLNGDRTLKYQAEPVDYPYRPSVDVFFESLAAHWAGSGEAVLLTGMGSDGARGLAKLRQAGWHTIAQDQGSSVVYGMPKAAIELHAACEVVPIGQIAARLLAHLGSYISTLQ